MQLTAIILDLFKNDEYFVAYDNPKEVVEKLKLPLLDKTEFISSDNFLNDLYAISEGYDGIAVVYSYSPFYCWLENQKLVEDFVKYKADYGFGDNHPKGVVMEILRREALPVMENVRKEAGIPITRNVFEEIIFKDVNMFDLENLYAQENLRTFRLAFFRDNQQDAHTIDTIQELFEGKKYNHDISFNDLAKLVKNHREKMKTIPKFFEVEISTGCYQNCHFCPRPSLDSHEAFMNLEDYQIILEKILAFSTHPTISFTGMGEGMKNPHWIDIVNHTLDKKVECLLETSLSNVDGGEADKLIALDDELLTVIISIDAVDETLYDNLRPSEKPFNSILKEIEKVLLKRPKNTYLQLIKMNENFENIVAFHRYFSKYTDNVIIQKYNHYRNFLPERRLNPMQPFEKIDCWHLKRDMVIKVNGDVPVCKQDLKKEYLLGNLLTESTEAISAKGNKYFRRHVEGWDFCQNCDEYYTYNY